MWETTVRYTRRPVSEPPFTELCEIHVRNPPCRLAFDVLGEVRFTIPELQSPRVQLLSVACLNRIRHSRVRVALLSSLLLVGACRDGSATRPADGARKPNQIQFSATSAKLAMFVVDTVRTVHSRVIATLPAMVVANEDHTVRVTTPVTGRIVSLLAQAGDHVSAGQPLARIRSGDIAQVTSEVEKARSAERSATMNLARSTDLYEHKLIASREVEQARNDADQARAELARASRRAAQLGVAGRGVEGDYLLRAPVSGVVIERLANPGLEVRPDNGVALFTVSSLSSLWLAVSVPQRDLAVVHRGARLHFVSDAAPGRAFDARVSFVSDALDPNSRSATARAVIENADGALRVQTSGEAQVIVEDTGSSVSIPTRAVVTHGEQSVVFVRTAPGTFERRVVTVRDDDGTMSTLSAGLSAGECVVTTGSLLLSGEMDRAH